VALEVHDSDDGWDVDKAAGDVRPSTLKAGVRSRNEMNSRAGMRCLYRVFLFTISEIGGVPSMMVDSQLMSSASVLRCSWPMMAAEEEVNKTKKTQGQKEGCER
jgi:hypothetical protein